MELKYLIPKSIKSSSSRILDHNLAGDAESRRIINILKLQFFVFGT